MSIKAHADDAGDDGSGTKLNVATGVKTPNSLDQRVARFCHELHERCLSEKTYERRHQSNE